MAKKKEDPKLVKMYFSKRPPGTGYHANHVHLVPEATAAELRKAGYCRDATATLPEDLPGREAFIKAGFETTEDIAALEDPTEVDGIGEATAAELGEWFKNNS